MAVKYDEVVDVALGRFQVYLSESHNRPRRLDDSAAAGARGELFAKARERLSERPGRERFREAHAYGIVVLGKCLKARLEGIYLATVDLTYQDMPLLLR